MSVRFERSLITIGITSAVNSCLMTSDKRNTDEARLLVVNVVLVEELYQQFLLVNDTLVEELPRGDGVGYDAKRVTQQQL